MKKKFATLLLLLAPIGIINAQNYWKKIEKSKQLRKTEIYSRKETLKDFQLFSLNTDKFKEKIKSSSFSKNTLILPDRQGKKIRFSIKETPILQERLAKKYPNIKTYTGKGIDNPNIKTKITIGSDGLHFLISYSNKESLYIDPYTKDNKTFISYRKSDIENHKNQPQCKITNKNKFKSDRTDSDRSKKKNNSDGILRTFKIAIASTGEYSQFHLTNQNISSNASDNDKKAAVLSAMNTTMARVNQIYERDLSVRMIIVNDNDKLIFLDPQTDNLDNDDADTLIDQSQVVCDSNIGSANYDIGHTFSTGAGGLAGVGVICSSSRKAEGVTGQSEPINDPYDIDFVAHEIGHQFGASHTFNNSCTGNRSSANAVEPGSGSTIMAYAGICSPNIQNNSDAYFHSISIEQMWNTILSNGSCAIETNTNNTPPTANAGNNVSIPKSTPFILKGIGTDTEGSSGLTYNWEQIDTEIATMPPLATNSGGPLFRSLPSTNVPYRYFPSFETVLNGSSSNTWEVLPSVPREMNFSLTVRDNNSGAGAFARDDIKVSVVDAPPFTIEDQNYWAQNNVRTINWVVAQTNTSPINCQKVNIKLSTNGGTSFDIDLATNIDNDGAETIMLPASVPDTDEAILMIEAADNIFYNITSKFLINSTPTYVLKNNTGDAAICNTATSSFTFDINYIAINGFDETVNLSVSNAPNGAQVNITPSSSIQSDGTIKVTLTGLNNVTPDQYIMTLNANSNSIQKNLELKINVANTLCLSNGSLTYDSATTFVKFNTIQNETSSKDVDGYSDFKSISTNVNKESSCLLTVNANTDGSFTTATYVWFDWNQNCVLEENEKYDLGQTFNNTNGATSNSPLEITIPSNAILGSTTMRVSTKYQGDEVPLPCETNFDGEVEDYTIIIDEPTASTKDFVFNKFRLFPNPSDGNFRLSFEKKDPSQIYLNLYDLRGRLIDKSSFNEKSKQFSEYIYFNSVSKGIYLLEIQNGKYRTMQKLMIN